MGLTGTWKNGVNVAMLTSTKLVAAGNDGKVTCNNRVSPIRRFWPRAHNGVQRQWLDSRRDRWVRARYTRPALASSRDTAGS
jgi:hypothetical protein